MDHLPEKTQIVTLNDSWSLYVFGGLASTIELADESGLSREFVYDGTPQRVDWQRCGARIAAPESVDLVRPTKPFVKIKITGEVPNSHGDFMLIGFYKGGLLVFRGSGVRLIIGEWITVSLDYFDISKTPELLKAGKVKVLNDQVKAWADFEGVEFFEKDNDWTLRVRPSPNCVAKAN